MSKQTLEILSPAGDLACLRFALAYGADAVYLGSKEFGMRSSSTNFSEEDLHKAAGMAHALGKKIYLTLNTLPSNQEISRIPATITMAKEAGVDAFIVADLGILSLAKQYAPEVEIHLSTQAGITNYAAANVAYRLGASRVVLARELALVDIAEIRAKIPDELELEVFVHGAMCMSVSGRCLISQYLTGRDANQGKCPQSCRWKYTLHEEKRPGESYEIGEGEGGSYILSADDLCTAPILDKIVAAGANSLKIEGRSKSFYYVASVTAAYRSALNAVKQAGGAGFTCPQFALDELSRTSHRPYSTGFFLGPQGATQNPKQEGYIREWQVLGVVQTQQDGCVFATQRGKFVLGDELEALLPQGRVVTFTPAHIWDENGEEISATPHPEMKFSVPVPAGENFPEYTILRRRTG